MWEGFLKVWEDFPKVKYGRLSPFTNLLSRKQNTWAQRRVLGACGTTCDIYRDTSRVRVEAIRQAHPTLPVVPRESGDIFKGEPVSGPLWISSASCWGLGVAGGFFYL